MHPDVHYRLANQRNAELIREADAYRLAKSVQRDPEPKSPRRFARKLFRRPAIAK